MSVNMPEKPKFPKGFLIYLIATTFILMIVPFLGGIYIEEIKAGITLFAMIDVVPFIIYLFFYIPKVMDYLLAKKNFPEYEKKELERQRLTEERIRAHRENAKKRLEIIEQEKEEAVLSQQNQSPWAVKYSVYPCPHCGHYKVRNATMKDKELSIAIWGIASPKIAANYKCECCGEMWE